MIKKSNKKCLSNEQIDQTSGKGRIDAILFARSSLRFFAAVRVSIKTIIDGNVQLCREKCEEKEKQL